VRLLGCLVAGASTALGGFVVHRHVERQLLVDLPWGLALALVTLFAVVRAAGEVSGVHGLAASAGGWVLIALLVQSPRPEGDFLLAGDALGYGFLLGGMAVLGVAVVTGVTAERRQQRP